VNDGHGNMRNLLIDELHEAARLVVGRRAARNKPLVRSRGSRRGFEGGDVRGLHSRAGTPNGLLSHTWVGMLVHEIRLQGKPAGETLLDAAIVGSYGTPVVLVHGADDVVREAKADLGDDLETVEVKRVSARPPRRPSRRSGPTASSGRRRSEPSAGAPAGNPCGRRRP